MLRVAASRALASGLLVLATAAAPRAALNLTVATPPGWDGPVVPRNSVDATAFSVPLPPVLIGNAPTTSFNFCTLNQGPDTVVPPWSTQLYLDDVPIWPGTGSTIPAGQFAMWLNTAQGGPASIVRGGLHHLRVQADVLNQVPETSETDNAYVEAFVWQPMTLATETPVLRVAPPLKDPIGSQTYSVDGFRAADGPVWWTAVAVLPVSASADYDVLLYDASTGSQDGFENDLAWSSDPVPGNTDFALVNYNVATGTMHDYGVLNWNGAGSDFRVQRVDAPYWGLAPAGITRLGPFTIAADEILDVHELELPIGTPAYVSVRNLSGNANLALSAFDGTVDYHDKTSATATVDAGGDGMDEHLPAITPPTTRFFAFAVYKSASGDLPKAATYEVVVSVGGDPVDAPVAAPSPAELTLSPPQPNPARGATQLRLDVPAGAGPAAVTVYDLRGRRVATLAEGVRPPGRHALTWDGRDAGGRRVAAGTYFVRAETATASRTRKVTLLR